MSRPSLKRKVATLRAVMWLNSFRDSLDSGVLQIAPTLSGDRTTEIERELAIFRDTHLPRINRDLQISADVRATVHLKRWDCDTGLKAQVERYPLTKLLEEQQRLQGGSESLRRAREIVATEDLSDPDNAFILGMVLTRAEGLLARDAVQVEPIPEPGVVGERLRDCDEAIEAVLYRLKGLRKNEYELDDACKLSETCAVLHERAFQLAKHIRDEGLV